MKPKKKKEKMTLMAIIITTFSALILAGVFFGTYYYVTDQSLNSYERSVREVVDTINTTNKSTKSLLKDNVPDPETCRKKLPEIINNLKDAKTQLDGLIPGDTFKLQHNAIKDGLNSNLTMYNQILNILQNPNSKDISSSIQDFTKYRDDSENSYSQFGMKGMSISVLNNANDFLKAFELYANQLAKAQRDADIKASQTLDFCTKADELVAKFIPIKTDFSTELNNARNKSDTYDDLITLANSYMQKNSDLEKDFLKTSVPENCKTVKDSLKAVFGGYDTYIQSFILAVGQERDQAAQVTTGTLTEDQLKQIYSDSSNQYLNVQDKYDGFLNMYTTFKATNIK
ncbi:MAG: hypothetical protein Q8930_06060 [Bacillota bacterium]|nr:hypothetical protein [Bacillota bacterium]